MYGVNLIPPGCFAGSGKSLALLYIWIWCRGERAAHETSVSGWVKPDRPVKSCSFYIAVVNKRLHFPGDSRFISDLASWIHGRPGSESLSQYLTPACAWSLPRLNLAVFWLYRAGCFFWVELYIKATPLNQTSASVWHQANKVFSVRKQSYSMLMQTEVLSLAKNHICIRVRGCRHVVGSLRVLKIAVVTLACMRFDRIKE